MVDRHLVSATVAAGPAQACIADLLWLGMPLAALSDDLFWLGLRRDDFELNASAICKVARGYVLSHS